MTDRWDGFVSFISGEWMLTTKAARPNGGGVVLARALWSSTFVYGAILVFRELVDPVNGLALNIDAIPRKVSETITWLGAIFAGIYASLSAKFAAQWTYLAQLYNQIKSAEVGAAGNDAAKPILAKWKAAFIEDAYALHLSTKLLFAGAVADMGQSEEVIQVFRELGSEGEDRLRELIAAAVRLRDEAYAAPEGKAKVESAGEDLANA